MKYEVIISRASQKAINRLDADIHSRIIRKLESLEDDPRPMGVEKLAGSGDLYRVRSGDWRIVYMIQDRNLVVPTVKVAHRGEVYR